MWERRHGELFLLASMTARLSPRAGDSSVRGGGSGETLQSLGRKAVGGRLSMGTARVDGQPGTHMESSGFRAVTLKFTSQLVCRSE